MDARRKLLLFNFLACSLLSTTCFHGMYWLKYYITESCNINILSAILHFFNINLKQLLYLAAEFLE